LESKTKSFQIKIYKNEREKRFRAVRVQHASFLTLHDSEIVDAHVTLADDLIAQTSRSCLVGVLGLVLSVREPNEVLVVGVHVRQLIVNHKDQLLFAPLFALSNVSCDDSLGLLGY
jgi:hypothetical protein